MSTRADFYVGRGVEAEWLGSIAHDGYPSSIPPAIKMAAAEDAYRVAVTELLVSRMEKDATLAGDGWPWGWDDSRTTDYAYAFAEGACWGSYFGGPWFDPLTTNPSETQDWIEYEDRLVFPVFPDMHNRRNVAPAGSPRSGVQVRREAV